MARPRIKDGWTPIVNSLRVALDCADLPKYARVVLCEVQSQCYGKNAPMAASISPCEIARVYGYHQPHITRAIAYLVQCGFVTREGNLLKPVKDYERWTYPDGRPRLSEGEKTAAETATHRRLAHASLGMETIPRQVCPPHTSLGMETHTSSGMGAPISPYVPPLEEGFRKTSERPHTAAAAAESVPEIATLNGPDDQPRPLADHPEPDRAELARIVTIADDLWPMLNVGIEILRVRRAYPLDHLEAAIREVAGWTRPPRFPWKAIRSRLESYRVHGLPAPPPAGAPATAQPSGRSRGYDYDAIARMNFDDDSQGS